MDKERRNTIANIWDFFVPRNDSLFRVLLRTPIDGFAAGLIAHNIRWLIEYPPGIIFFVPMSITGVAAIAINRIIFPPLRTEVNNQPPSPPQIPPGPPTSMP